MIFNTSDGNLYLITSYFWGNGRKKTEISNTQSFLIWKQYSDFFIVMPINIFYKKFVIEN